MEIFMRTMIKTLTLGLGLFTAAAANAQLGYYTELSTSYGPREVNDSLGGGLYLSATNKFSDEWRAGLESSTGLSYRSGGETKFSQRHGYIRVPVTRSGLNWVPGWKTSFTTRWTLPTNAGAQTAGGWGAMLLRPAFSKDFGAFSLLVRPQVSVALVDRAYQKFVLPGEAPKGNTLFTWTVEAIPAYKLTDNMSLTLASWVSQAYTGGAPGADGSFGTASFNYELIVDIPVKLGPLGFSASVYNTTSFNENFSIFETETSSYTLYVKASF
jgi:hypothetical protein